MYNCEVTMFHINLTVPVTYFFSFTFRHPAMSFSNIYKNQKMFYLQTVESLSLWGTC